MASAWGDSWGDVWGDSWGAAPAAVTTPPAIGFSGRPKKSKRQERLEIPIRAVCVVTIAGPEITGRGTVGPETIPASLRARMNAARITGIGMVAEPDDLATIFLALGEYDLAMMIGASS